jgi:hypothetical protein
VSRIEFSSEVEYFKRKIAIWAAAIKSQKKDYSIFNNLYPRNLQDTEGLLKKLELNCFGGSSNRYSLYLKGSMFNHSCRPEAARKSLSI